MTCEIMIQVNYNRGSHYKDICDKLNNNWQVKDNGTTENTMDTWNDNDIDWVLCYLMTPGPSKDILCHVDHSLFNVCKVRQAHFHT